MAKLRSHNEYFRTVSLGNRKSCASCKAKLPIGEVIWSWGEYANAKWHTVDYFCVACFPQIKAKLVDHADDCGCHFNLIGYGGQKLPNWLTLNGVCDAKPS